MALAKGSKRNFFYNLGSCKVLDTLLQLTEVAALCFQI